MLRTTQVALLTLALVILSAGMATSAETFLECTGGQADDNDTSSVACDPQTNDQLWHDADDHNFCRQSAVVGCSFEEQCLGRCGPGCGLTAGAGVYALDCTEHDQCCRIHGGCVNPFDASCGDEWQEAADDFIFGDRNCGPCALGVPSVSRPSLVVLSLAVSAFLVLFAGAARRLRSRAAA